MLCACPAPALRLPCAFLAGFATAAVRPRHRRQRLCQPRQPRGHNHHNCHNHLPDGARRRWFPKPPHHEPWGWCAQRRGGDLPYHVGAGAERVQLSVYRRLRRGTGGCGGCAQLVRHAGRWTVAPPGVHALRRAWEARGIVVSGKAGRGRTRRAGKLPRDAAWRQRGHQCPCCCSVLNKQPRLLRACTHVVHQAPAVQLLGWAIALAHCISLLPSMVGR